MTVTSFGPLQKLYEAALDALNPDKSLIATKLLREAVVGVEQYANNSDVLGHVREAARELVRKELLDRDEVDIDDENFTYHNGTDGYWVGAWIFISDESLKSSD